MRVTRHAYAVPGWGVGELWVGDGRVVLAHDPPAARVTPSDHTPLAITTPKGTPGAPTDTLSGEEQQERDAFAADVLQRIHSYFAGERVSFADVALDLDETTGFQRDAAEALRVVPWGEVVTYGELAELAGYPRAARAAGTFCAENRFSLLVPCHRVVAAGGIGGYGSLGVEYKRRLLRLEGHVPL